MRASNLSRHFALAATSVVEKLLLGNIQVLSVVCREKCIEFSRFSIGAFKISP
jgi:hypothetical protein